LVLRRMTGELWPSALVAAVFAIHPLRAESVAWVSERKDVLSGFFFALTLGAYERYARRPSRLRYAAVAALFAFGLLSKNMLVTLPFVLLLLDYWPLGRLELSAPHALRPLLTEKIPLFLLSLASCIATFLTPEKISDLREMPLSFRLENAVVSYSIYLRELFWPAGLAIPYLDARLSIGKVMTSASLLAIISLFVFYFRRHRYLVVGWLWYLGMTVPVAGLVQFSYYVHADRYTYLPQIGLSIMMVWMIADGCSSWRRGRLLLTVGGAMTVVVLMVCARLQASYWRNTETLFRHTLAVAPDNLLACKKLASFYSVQDRSAEALEYYAKALEISPDDADLLYDQGNAFARGRDWDNAIRAYRHALQITPNQPDILNNLGSALVVKMQVADAIACFEAALKLNPESAGTHYNLAVLLISEGRLDDAVQHLREARRITPDAPQIPVRLGDTLIKLGRPDEAGSCYQAAWRLNPGDPAIKAKLQALGISIPN